MRLPTDTNTIDKTKLDFISILYTLCFQLFVVIRRLHCFINVNNYIFFFVYLFWCEQNIVTLFQWQYTTRNFLYFCTVITHLSLFSVTSLLESPGLDLSCQDLFSDINRMLKVLNNGHIMGNFKTSFYKFKTFPQQLKFNILTGQHLPWCFSVQCFNNKWFIVCLLIVAFIGHQVKTKQKVFQNNNPFCEDYL